MRRAIVVGEPRDLVGIQLDPPGGSAQLAFIGVGAELCKQHIFLGPRRDLEPALLPKGVELGDEIALRALAERVVEVPQPARLVAPLGKGVRAAPGEIAENSEIVASLADRTD